MSLHQHFIADRAGVIGISEYRRDNPDATFLSDLYLCFCFSVQTLSTIGRFLMLVLILMLCRVWNTIGSKDLVYTYYSRDWSVLGAHYNRWAIRYSTNCHVCNLLHSQGAAYAKIARPTKISRQIIFSNVAVINQSTMHITGKLTQLLLRKLTLQFRKCWSKWARCI